MAFSLYIIYKYILNLIIARNCLFNFIIKIIIFKYKHIMMNYWMSRGVCILVIHLNLINNINLIIIKLILLLFLHYINSLIYIIGVNTQSVVKQWIQYQLQRYLHHQVALLNQQLQSALYLTITIHWHQAQPEQLVHHHQPHHQ